MEDDGSAACFIWLVVLIMFDLLILGIWSAFSYVKNRDIDKNADTYKRNPVRVFVSYSAWAQKYEHIGILIFTALNFASGCLFSTTVFKDILEMMQNSNQFWHEWPLFWQELGIIAAFSVLYIVLCVLFGIWIPRAMIITLPIETNAEEQIISMVNEGYEQGVLQDSEAEMITNIFEFGDKEAKDIMINRSSIVAIDSQIPLPDAIDFMISERNSRYPVYEENLDHIIGILHFKDAVRLQAEGKRLRGKIGNYTQILRKAVFIPETRNLDTLFKSMQASKTQMVIVVDEYGQTSGIVAMEDLLEEIVGNLMDEYDVDEEYIEEKGENVYEIDGLTPLEELEEELQITFDCEEIETLNGFIINQMEHIPSENERFEMDFKGYHFKVLSVENKMIKNVLVKKQLNS